MCQRVSFLGDRSNKPLLKLWRFSDFLKLQPSAILDLMSAFGPPMKSI